MGRRRQPIVLSDNDLASDSDPGPSPPLTSQPPERGARKTKDGAKKAWESLIPGQKKKKSVQSSKARSATTSSKTGKSARHTGEGEESTNDEPVQMSAAKTSRKSSTRTYRAPLIDPDGSDNESAPMNEATEKTSGASAADNSSIPPRFRNKQSTSRVSAERSQADESSSMEDPDDEDGPSDSLEESEDEDDGLQEMEKNPQALEKVFADEAAYWAHEDDVQDPPPRRSSSHQPEESGLASQRPQVRHSPTPSSGSRSTHRGQQAIESTQARYANHARSVEGREMESSRKRAAREPEVDENENDPVPRKKVSKPAHTLGKERSSGRTQSGSAGHPQMQGARTGMAGSKSGLAPENSHKKHATGVRREEIPRFVESRDGDDLGDDSSDAHDQPTQQHKRKKRAQSGKECETPPTKRTRRDGGEHGLEVSDASPSDSDTSDSGIEIVFPERGKLKLDHQHRRVRRVVQRAIFSTLADVALKNAFPDGLQKHGKVVYRALLKAAADFGYGDIVKRLKKQDQYAAELSKIASPVQRIPTFRGHVRKVAEGQPATAFGLTFGDKEKGDWLQHGRRYIYPFSYENNTIESHKPYSPPVFVETLRAAFFKRPNSLGFKISDRFESTLPEKPDEKEIPAAMLALVATTLHAAIQDCKQGYTAPRDFTTNEYWGVYKDHIQELSTIRMAGPVQYHVLMHSLWRQISDPLGARGRAGPTGTSFLNVQDMARE
ncbi:hypothetical protein OH77DRAFT_1590904 [Trametes cingulata]|nr:hypothetical protein OH77DRAFT_1590904 [Trametes cingulata]